MSWLAVAGALLQGWASRSEGKESRKASKNDRRAALMNADYQMRLADYLGQKDKAEDQRLKREGWDNWYTDNKPVRNVPDEPSLEDYLRNIK